MASPDTDKGWIKLAHELRYALSLADFTKAQRYILEEVFTQSFGKAKRQWASLSPTALEKRSGIDKTAICRAIRTLIAGQVLDRSGRRVRFLKDYDRWERNGKPALSLQERQLCASAPDLANADQDDESAVDQIVNNSLTKSSTKLTVQSTLLTESTTIALTESTTKVDSIVNDLLTESSTPSYMENLENGELKRETALAKTSQPEPVKPSPQPSAGLLPFVGNKPQRARDEKEWAEIYQIAAKAQTAFPMAEQVIRIFITGEGDYRPQVYATALDRLKAKGPKFWNRAFLLKVLEGVDADATREQAVKAIMVKNEAAPKLGPNGYPLDVLGVEVTPEVAERQKRNEEKRRRWQLCELYRKGMACDGEAGVRKRLGADFDQVKQWVEEDAAAKTCNQDKIAS